jgi:flagellar biosynthesis/type III secretory pathway chaperone
MPQNRMTELNRADLDTLQQLRSLLEAEREALKNRAVEKLHSLLENKRIHLDNLHKHAIERSKLLDDFGLSHDHAGMATYLHQQQTGDAAAKALLVWQQLQAALKECHHNNEVNARIAGRTHQAINALLDLIRGNNNSREAVTLYGQNGARQYNRNPQLFGKA